MPSTTTKKHTHTHTHSRSAFTTVDGNQKSCGHQLRLVVEIPLFTTGFSTIPGGCLGFLNHQQYWAFGTYQADAKGTPRMLPYRHLILGTSHQPKTNQILQLMGPGSSPNCCCNPYKWPFRWVIGVITLDIGVITSITGRGPSCSNIHWTSFNQFKILYGFGVLHSAQCSRPRSL